MNHNSHNFSRKHEFPLCPSEKCWCYNCHYSTLKLSTFSNTQVNDFDLLAGAKKLRDDYLSIYLVLHADANKTSVLGLPMAINDAKSCSCQFPLCPDSSKCWCMSCSLTRVKSRAYQRHTFGNPNHGCYWDEDDYHAEALESAEKVKRDFEISS